MANVPDKFTRNKILDNIASLFSGSLIAQGMTVLALLFTARQVGATDYGRYAAAFALTGFTSILFNLGLDLWLLSQGGRQPGQLNQFISTVLLIKSLGGLPWFVIIAVSTIFLNQNTFPRNILLLSAFTVWLDSLFATTLTAFKTSLHNRITSLLEAGSDILWFLTTLVFITLNTRNVVVFIEIRSLVLLLTLTAALLTVKRFFGFSFNLSVLRMALSESLPFAVSEFLSWTLLRSDVIIISLALGAFAAGVYSPAVGVVNGLFLVPSSVYMVMVPVLSNRYGNDPKQANITAKRTILLLVVVGLLLTLGFTAGAPLLVSFLESSFSESLKIMQILSPILLLKSISFAMATIIVATDNQGQRTIVQAIATGTNIILNLIIVNYLGVYGVAAVYVFTELLILVGYGWIVQRYRTHQHLAESPAADY
jgi:O-antigen/teichoic acid export membrane protein